MKGGLSDISISSTEIVGCNNKGEVCVALFDPFRIFKVCFSTTVSNSRIECGLGPKRHIRFAIFEHGTEESYTFIKQKDV